MSIIETNIIDPGKSGPVPEIDPDGDAIRSDEIREPIEDITPIEPDPEEGRRDLPNIRHANKA
jgi:hypothetical protein